MPEFMLSVGPAPVVSRGGDTPFGTTTQANEGWTLGPSHG